jgi:hypothetical protein
MDMMVSEIIEGRERSGTVYLYVKGPDSVARINKKLFELSFHVDKIIIFGDQTLWPRMSENIFFTGSDDIFTDNHQRFFIYQSSSYNAALVARQTGQEGEQRIEAAVSSAPDAVSLLAMTLSKRIPLLG